MRWFSTWLRDEPRNFLECLNLMITCLLIDFTWSLFMAMLLVDLGVLNALAPVDFVKIIRYAFSEELLFRWGPLILPLTFFKKERIGILLLISLCSSLAFGILHGHWYNLLIQGVGGITLCIFFIKAAAVKPEFGRLFTHPFQIRALAITTSAHAFFNILILLINEVSQ